MRRNLFISIFICIAILVSASTAFGAETLSFVSTFDPETGNITLTGSGSGYITVRMARVESDGTDPAESLDVSNPPLVFDKIYADGDFTYTCIFPDGAPGGQYMIYLRDNDTLKTAGFRFYDVEAAERDIIPLLNNAIANKNFTDFSSVITSSAESLGIDTSDSMYQSEADFIIELLYKCNKSFDSAPEFYNKYYEAYAIASISGADQEEIETAMEKYSSYLGINYSADYKNETRLTPSVKSMLCSLLGSYDYVTALPDGGSFDEILTSLKPVAAVRSASKWQDLSTAMTVDYVSDFSFIYEQNTQYKSLSSLTQVYSKMMSDVSDFATLEDVQDSFDAAVKALAKDSTKGSTTSSRGSSGGSGGSSVTMPKDNSAIDVNPLPAPLEMFEDVASGYWGFEAINELAKSKIINGYEDGSFKPESYISRAEFIKIVVSLAGYELTPSDFDDVDSNAWYSNYVGAAEKAGIAQGADGKFNPEYNITRQDASTIIYRVISEKELEFSEGKSFTDSDSISDYAQEAIAALSSIGIINGYTTGEFLPLGNITRAEAAQILYKAKTHIS